MPRAASVVVPLVVAFGLWSEWVVSGFGRSGGWVPDLVTGLVIGGGGVVAWARRRESRVGILLILASVAWFAGNFGREIATATPLLGRSLADVLVGIHRAFLAHAILTFPSGSLRTTDERIAVGAAYATTIGGSILFFDSAPVVLATLVAVAAFMFYRRSIGQERRARRVSLEVGLILAAAVGAGDLLVALLGSHVAADPQLLLYEFALIAVAVLLAARIRPGLEDTAVADIVVDLGDVRSGDLRDSLAEALGDPGLNIGYPVGSAADYVDATGRELDVVAAAVGRTRTPIERDGEVVAVLLHDSAVLEDSALVAAIGAAARLESRHAELQAEVRAQITALIASRRRLVDAGDIERQRLAQRLNDGAIRRLRRLGDTLEANGRANLPGSVGQRVELASTQVARTIDELRELAQGLHPPELRDGGLAVALRGLTEHLPFPVDLEVADVRLSPDVDVAIYYVCAEGLANATKHADASRATLVVRATPTAVTIVLTDDGVGGANVANGTGLRGLTDRIEALGGRLLVDSPLGRGTRLTTDLPIGVDR